MSDRLRTTPLISVVTAVRNAVREIDACVESVAAQTGIAVEHVVVDGASTDGTVDALQRMDAPCLHWISEPDDGIYPALNKGVDLARGDWVLFLGADDRLRPDALRTVAPLLIDPGTVYYGDVWMTARGIRYAGPFSRHRLAVRNICQQAIFYPRRVFDTFRFDPVYPIQADWVLNMACRACPAFRFAYVPVIVADYNDTSGISSRARDRTLERDYPRLLRRHFPPWIGWPLALAVGIKRAAVGIKPEGRA